MAAPTLALHDGLAKTRRLPIAVRSDVARWELVVLLGIGAATAILTSYVKLDLGIPGHAIVRTVLPFSFGMALVPRRGSGSIMGASALVTMMATRHTGFGAVASMIAVGVFLDLALWKAKAGLPLYLAFVAAGLGGNAVAFLARAGGKLAGLDPGIVTFSAWWPRALMTYALCGALSGLVSVAAWFQLRRGRA